MSVASTEARSSRSAVDTVGAGPGERVFYVTAREAAIALPDRADSPVDAAIVGIVEGIEEAP